jgi:Choline/ethanolamine kinase
MENWFNQRLNAYIRFKPTAQNLSARLTFNSRRFHLCHTDLAPRNIIMADDGSLCPIDWAFAGIYPSYFETYALKARLLFEPLFSWLIKKKRKNYSSYTESNMYRWHVGARCHSGNAEVILQQSQVRTISLIVILHLIILGPKYTASSPPPPPTWTFGRLFA